MSELFKKFTSCKPALIYIIIALLVASSTFLLNLSLTNFAAQVSSIALMTFILVAICALFPKHGSTIGWIILILNISSLLCSSISMMIGQTKSILDNRYGYIF